MYEETRYTEGRGTVTGLVRDLTEQIGRLVRDEFALMKAEASEKASQAGRGAAMIAVGGILGLCALLILLSAGVIALGQVVELWLAALIVGAVTALIAIILVSIGRANLKPAKLAPRRTMSSVRDDVQFTRAQMRRSA